MDRDDVPPGWNKAFTAAVARVGWPSGLWCGTSAMWGDGREPTEAEIEDWVHVIEEMNRSFPSTDTGSPPRRL